MSYKCVMCGISDVGVPGEVCELCALGQDPFADSSLGQVRDTPNRQTNNDPFSRQGKSRKILLGERTQDDIIVTQPEDTDIYTPSYTPPAQPTQSAGPGVAGAQSGASSGLITQGVVKNLTVDDQPRPTLFKWFRTLFFGVPFSLENAITNFQVYPDFSGTSQNAMGNACDQVIVYGKIKNGVISENNDVEVYGHRDSNNNVVASHIRNTASGTSVKADGVLGPIGAWLITGLLVLGIVSLVIGIGPMGLLLVAVLLLGLINLPLTFKILGGLIAGFFGVLGWLIGRAFRKR